MKKKEDGQLMLLTLKLFIERAIVGIKTEVITELFFRLRFQQAMSIYMLALLEIKLAVYF